MQAITADRPYGFRTNQPDNKAGVITNLGSYPLNVIEIEATVSLLPERFADAQVIALDANGYATEKTVPITSVDGAGLRFELARDSVYHIITTQHSNRIGYWQLAR